MSDTSASPKLDTAVHYPVVPDGKTPVQTILKQQQKSEEQEQQQQTVNQPKPKIKKCPVQDCRFRSAFIGAIEQCLRYKHKIADEGQIKALMDEWTGETELAVEDLYHGE